MIAHPAADAGERVGLEQYAISILQPAGFDQRHIGRNIHADRAGVLAGRFEEGAADHGRAALIVNMLLIFRAKIAQCGEDGVGRGLAQPAQGIVLR